MSLVEKLHTLFSWNKMKDSTEMLGGPLKIPLTLKKYVISVIKNYFLSFFSCQMAEQHKEILLLSIRKTTFDFSTRKPKIT